ncbi:MAG: sugar phosphate isomerase/epimerase family protein [Bryobacteraceae bacterium]
MKRNLNRREFSLAASVGLGALGLPALKGAPAPRLKIGHTGITWGYRPDNAEQAIKDIASAGYNGFESFGNIIEAWEAKGGMGRLLDEAKLPLISAYCGVNLTDAAQRGAEVAKLVGWGKLIKKYGGSVAVIGPNNVKRPSYDFAANKANIVAALNDMCKALADVGITGVMHQHTGTCVEFRDEVYAVMEAVDTRYVKFGPDVGQLQKGGSDPVKIVKDFLPVIRHVHLKDFDGGPYWSAYCPLGRGKVDLPAVLNLLETQKDLHIVMVELDPEGGPPLKPLETAEISKAYLKNLGYTFRS